MANEQLTLAADKVCSKMLPHANALVTSVLPLNPVLLCQAKRQWLASRQSVEDKTRI